MTETLQQKIDKLCNAGGDVDYYFLNEAIQELREEIMNLRQGEYVQYRTVYGMALQDVLALIGEKK